MPVPPEKLSAQPIAQVGDETELHYVVQSGQTRRQTRTQLRAAILSVWQGFIGTFLGAANTAAARTAIGAVGSADNITGSAAKLTTARTIAATGDAAWSTSFDGSANVTAALTLATTGVSAATYGSVTVDAKGRVTAGTTATPVANGGTGQITIAAAAAAIAVPKLAWTSYTPTVTASTGTYTTVSATGSYMVAFGICNWRATITLTTIGTGATANITLPVAALASMVSAPIPARANNTGKSGSAVINAGLVTARCVAADATDLLNASGSVVEIYGSYPVA